MLKENRPAAAPVAPANVSTNPTDLIAAAVRYSDAKEYRKLEGYISTADVGRLRHLAYNKENFKNPFIRNAVFDRLVTLYGDAKKVGNIADATKCMVAAKKMGLDEFFVAIEIDKNTVPDAVVTTNAVTTATSTVSDSATVTSAASTSTASAASDLPTVTSAASAASDSVVAINTALDPFMVVEKSESSVFANIDPTSKLQQQISFASNPENDLASVVDNSKALFLVERFKNNDYYSPLRTAVVLRILKEYHNAVEGKDESRVKLCIEKMRDLRLDKNEFSNAGKTIMEDHPNRIRYGLSMIKAKARIMSPIIKPSGSSVGGREPGRLLLSGTLFTSRTDGKHTLHRNLTAVDEVVKANPNRRLLILSVQMPTEVFEGTNPMASESIPAWGATSYKVDNVSDAKVERIIFPILDHSFVSVITGKIVTRQELLPMLDKLQNFRMDEGDILIHCAAGKARSSTVTVAYLMEFENMGLLQAAETVRDARAIVGGIHKRNAMQKVFLVSYFLEKYEKDPAYRESLSFEEKVKNFELCKQLLAEAKIKYEKKPNLQKYTQTREDETVEETFEKLNKRINDVTNALEDPNPAATDEKGPEVTDNQEPKATGIPQSESKGKEKDEVPLLKEEGESKNKDSWLTKIKENKMATAAALVASSVVVPVAIVAGLAVGGIPIVAVSGALGLVGYGIYQLAKQATGSNNDDTAQEIHPAPTSREQQAKQPQPQESEQKQQQAQQQESEQKQPQAQTQQPEQQQQQQWQQPTRQQKQQQPQQAGQTLQRTAESEQNPTNIGSHRATLFGSRADAERRKQIKEQQEQAEKQKQAQEAPTVVPGINP